MRRFFCALGVALVLPASVPRAFADPDDAIEYRQHIMKTLDAQTAALGMILSGAAPEDNVVSHIDAIALAASTALKAFEPRVEGGNAKPEVWSNWADFSARMNEFATKTAEMSRIAHEQGKDEALGYAIEALSCKSCHDDYNKDRDRD